jgi:hypothetical protein
MTTSPRSYEIDFMLALVDFYVSDDADEPVRDIIKMLLAVHSDDTWRLSIGRSVTLGPHVDASLHTLTGDATTTAPDLLRMLAERVLAPHDTALTAMEQPS